MNFLVKKFYKEMQTNRNFKQKILDAKKRYCYLTEPKEKVCTIIEKIVIPFAEQRGYNFDVYDLLIFEEEASAEGAQLLEPNDLCRVSAGFEGNAESASFLQNGLCVPGESLKGIADWYRKNKALI